MDADNMINAIQKSALSVAYQTGYSAFKSENVNRTNKTGACPDIPEEPTVMHTKFTSFFMVLGLRIQN